MLRGGAQQRPCDFQRACSGSQSESDECLASMKSVACNVQKRSKGRLRSARVAAFHFPDGILVNVRFMPRFQQRPSLCCSLVWRAVELRRNFSCPVFVTAQIILPSECEIVSPSARCFPVTNQVLGPVSSGEAALKPSRVSC